MLRNLGFIGIHKKKSKIIGDIGDMINQNNNISIDDILSVDTIVDELQNQNKVLLNFLNKERVKQMVDYIIKEPPADANHNKGFKFPWICSQLFNIGDYNIMKYFLRTNKELEEEEKLEKLEQKKEEETKDNTNVDDVNKEKDKEKEKEKEKKVRKASIKETRKSKIKDNRIELLDYLLTFLSSNKEPNYVLCGYFASIIKTLLNMDQTLIIKYLYLHNKDFIRKLIYHSYRQSISEILNKIIQYNSNEEEFNIEEMSLIRMDILEGLFDKIDIDMDTEKLDSISTLIKSLATDERLLSDMLNNRKIIECLISRPFRDINLLKNNDKEENTINKRRNFIILIDTIISWLHYINTFDIDLPSTNEGEEKENENNNKKDYSFTHTLLSYEFFNVLIDLIKVNFNKKQDDTQEDNKILQCFDETPLVPLGLYRIKIVELLGNLFTYFKKIPLLYDQLLIDSHFFENAFNYLFEYELNNIYQEAFLFLLKKFLDYSKDHPLLADFLFLKLNLLETIITKLQDAEISENDEDNSKKDRFIFKSGNTTSRGYISFLISLSYKINTIIGGEPLRINNTLSREGSMSFITRNAPFVGKEEINKFYGMEEDELYEAVSNESKEKTSKLNCSVKSMEKYLNDKWTEYFDEHISDKIKLYETKLYKEENRDSIFRNPFVMENEEETMDNKNDFGLGDGEDPDGLRKSKKNGIPDLQKMLYEDNEIDINVNRFKMSMRLPRSNKNSMVKSGGSGKRNSLDDKSSKVVVDEIDIDIDSLMENDNKDNDNEEEEEENPLDKFKREKKKKEEEEDENPLDKFRQINSGEKKEEKEEEDDDDNPLDKFRRINSADKNNNNNNNEDDDDENPLDKFRSYNEDDNGNHFDQFRRMIHNRNNKDNNKKKEEDENPLDKFRGTNNEDNNNEDEEENPLDNFNKMKNNSNKKNEDKNEYEEEENPLDKFKKLNTGKKKENNNKEEDEDENPLDKFKRINSNKKNENNNKEEEDEDENPLDKLKRLNSNKKNENNNKEEEEEDENPLDKFKKLNENKKNENNKKEEEDEDENPLDILRGLKNSKKDEDNDEDDENPLDLLKEIRKNRKEEDNEEDKDVNPSDLLKDLQKTRNEFNNEINNEEDEDENPLDKFRKKNNKEK
jgi:hypothetical protein